jgi:hypothetical protein
VFLIVALTGVSFANSDGPLVVILGGSAILFSALPIVLPSGTVLRVTGLVTVAAAALLGYHEATILVFAGSLLGRLSSRSFSPEGLGHHFMGALFAAALAGASALTWNTCAYWTSSFGGLAAAVAPLAAGLVYSSLDLSGAALLASEGRSSGKTDALIDLTRTTYSLYLGQICLGVVAVLLWPSMREWGLVLLTVLGLILLYSFNLYLRVRSSYQETIRALGRVSELSFPALDGHAQRVADIAYLVGRRLGCTPKELENLNYAALLHGLGRVGEETDAAPYVEESIQPSRGAEIVERIPFLTETADLIRYQDGFPSPELAVPARVVKLGHVIGACAKYSIAYRAAVDSGEDDPAARAIKSVESSPVGASDPDIVSALADEIGAKIPRP